MWRLRQLFTSDDADTLTRLASPFLLDLKFHWGCPIIMLLFHSRPLIQLKPEAVAAVSAKGFDQVAAGQSGMGKGETPGTILIC